MENKVNDLIDIHYKCREYLDAKDYAGLLEFIAPYIERRGPNELKTIQILLQSFTWNDQLKPTIDELNEFFKQLPQ